MHCRPGSPCIVNCFGDQSCAGNSNIKANGATSLEINCNSYAACDSVIVDCGESICSINCASNACNIERVDVSTATTFQCSGDCPGAIQNLQFTFDPTAAPSIPTNSPSQSPSYGPEFLTCTSGEDCSCGSVDIYGTQPCTVDCSFDNSCDGSIGDNVPHMITCRENAECIVDCSGDYSCNEVIIDGSLATDVWIICEGEGSCNTGDSHFQFRCGTGDCHIECSDAAACDGILSLHSNPISFECVGDRCQNIVGIQDPFVVPTPEPTSQPTHVTSSPSNLPSYSPSMSTIVPSESPTDYPTLSPTIAKQGEVGPDVTTAKEYFRYGIELEITLDLDTNNVSVNYVKSYLEGIIPNIIAERVDEDCFDMDQTVTDVTLEYNEAVISSVIYVCDQDTEKRLINTLENDDINTDLIQRINGNDNNVKVIGEPELKYDGISDAAVNPTGAENNDLITYTIIGVIALIVCIGILCTVMYFQRKKLVQRQKTNRLEEGQASGYVSNHLDTHNNTDATKNVHQTSLPKLTKVASQSHASGPGSVQSDGNIVLPGSMTSGYPFKKSTIDLSAGDVTTKGNDLFMMNHNQQNQHGPLRGRLDTESTVEQEHVDQNGYIEENHDHGYLDNNAESDNDENEHSNVVMPEHVITGGNGFMLTAGAPKSHDNDYVQPPPVPPVPMEEKNDRSRTITNDYAMPQHNGVTKGFELDNGNDNDLIPPPVPPVPKDEDAYVLPGNTSSGTRQ